MPSDTDSSVDWEFFWKPNIKVIWKDGAIFRSVLNKLYKINTGTLDRR